MERATYTNNNLLVNQVRKLRRPEWQVQRTLENNRVRENTPELKTGLVHLAKQSSDNIVKLKKTKLCIKNMVSMRCKMVVKTVLENLGINFSKVELGEVEIIGKSLIPLN